LQTSALPLGYAALKEKDEKQKGGRMKISSFQFAVFGPRRVLAAATLKTKN
jgi:hypothetical protein